MSEAVSQTPSKPKTASSTGGFKHFLKATEIDTRMLGMIGALFVIWIGFHILSGGTFLTARNLWNLSVQTASVGVMATGMVLVIVTRNIDLSVGSILGVTGMIMAIAQTTWLTPMLGFDSQLVWILTLAVGLAAGLTIGALQGFVIAYMGVPAFIVTLGGLLIWRGAAWWVASGRTIPITDNNFKIIGGGSDGSIGSTWSWLIALVAIAFLALAAVNARRQRHRFHFPVKPIWAEVLTFGLGALAVVVATLVVNSYYLPGPLARRYAEASGIEVPEAGLAISFGYAVPVLLFIGVGIVMTFIARRTRFGRYVFAIGGNPEAAELAGINTKRVTMMVFALMGMLAAVGAAISTARLTSATNAQGTLDELYTIAAAVIGGTSLAGGAGTIAGAMLGALVMQSLQSGMVLLGMDTPLQNIVVGAVLVVAVWLDTIYRRRAA
ncbi:ABC transporter, membrane spanning protein (xylose) [Fulvimarina pelagi HTCC2506]|uniref:Xylose transport system permease protein XylH n=2 Tax=Fulvimarina pelagi TaxID=217511 RepID=Q0FZW7_9HYPH|nr:sugar ABC transporter permease [Fulvimarina pelagi]EAU40474.1 ABC transporter, membrane spanning protein (xylose) [Fulvimarina pelagi HTCC2506]BAT31501.1 xylose ABC transporter, membrane spanning protein [Fulvimarina pelagi]